MKEITPEKLTEMVDCILKARSHADQQKIQKIFNAARNNSIAEGQKPAELSANIKELKLQLQSAILSKKMTQLEGTSQQAENQQQQSQEEGDANEFKSYQP